MTTRKIILFIILNIAMLTLVSTPENVEAAGKMPEGSIIANVSIAKKKENEARQLLETEIATWQAGEDLILKSEFESFTIPRTVFEYDIEGTMKLFNERTKRTLTSLFMRQQNVHLPLIVQINEAHEAIQSINELDYINKEETLKDLVNVASQLDEAVSSITYIEGKDIPLDTIAEIDLKIPNLSNAVLTYTIDELNEYVINPNDSFLLLNAVEYPKHLTDSTEEISFVGSALYTLFLQTNFEIVERHAQLTQASYIEPGLDVAVSKKENKDLIVHNPNSISYKMEAKIQDDKLHMALKSAKTDLTYEYEFEKEREIKQRTLYRYSKKLKPGEQQTIQVGRKGLKIEVHRSTYEKNVFIDSEVISRDIYLPEPTIAIRIFN